MLAQRRFDTAEDGQTYRSKGPHNLIAFQYECERELGNVFNDPGIQLVSTNQPEVRYGTSNNHSESWCGLVRQKLQPANITIVVNCDYKLLTAVFSDPRYANWIKPNYRGHDLTLLS